MSGIARFVQLMEKYIGDEYSRQASLRPESLLSDILDEPGQSEFVSMLETEMYPKQFSFGYSELFSNVSTISELYTKLCVCNDDFAKFIGSPNSSDDESEKKKVDKKAEKKKAVGKAGASVSENVLATLIDAGDEAGEELLAEQLGYVKAVVIAERTHTPGKCIECEDRRAVVDCVECGDEFCSVCFLALHRKGNRKSHVVKNKPGTSGLEELKLQKPLVEDDEGPIDFGAPPEHVQPDFDSDKDFAFRAQFIPIRLDLKERQILRLLQAQLSVSTYTDAIDRPDLQSNKRVHAQILKICAFLSGVAASINYQGGQELLKSRQWKSEERLFRTVMELGRRYKVLNPDRMRTEYGRLMYLMMDAARNDVEQLLGFKVRAPMVTVASFLKEKGAEALLSDEAIEIATRAIDQMSEDGKKSRIDIRSEVKKKEAAVKMLARKYRNSKIDEDTIKWCLYSIGDNRSFLLQHRDPVQRMIRYLKKYFGPQVTDLPEKYSLAIYGGTDGSRLTHTHEKQYNYVLQSLTLWREILNDMFRLWCLAEEDMLDPACPYKLEDTGQGMQRVQQSPRVAKAMRDLLFRTQTKLGSWVGSSVVHLGDKNVPNALMFLDKYTQVARILSPIVICLDRLPELCEQPKTCAYIDTVFGGIETTRKDILVDFFKSAFDGSGADNFFDAGSCIDGRLTSAWHWCSMIQEKRFYPVLRLSGFTSFDGDWADAD